MGQTETLSDLWHKSKPDADRNATPEMVLGVWAGSQQIYQVIEFRRQASFQSFVEEMSNARWAGEEFPELSHSCLHHETDME